MPATAVESSDNASGTIVGYLAPVGAPDRTRGLVLGTCRAARPRISLEDLARGV